MRIAILIIGLILMLAVGLQSCAVSVGGSLSDDQPSVEGGALGLLMAFLFLVGGAFALGVPVVSLVTFLLAALIGLLAGSATPFSDLTIWGIVSFALAVLSFFGIREKQRQREGSQVRVS